MKIKKEYLYGGAGLVGGYLLGTSAISHHASGQFAPCEWWDILCNLGLGGQPSTTPSPVGTGKPTSPAVLKKTAANPPKIPAAVAAANKSQPALDFNPSDNLPGGPNDQINNFFGQLGAPCVPGLPVPCPLVILGGAIVALFLLKGRF